MAHRASGGAGGRNVGPAHAVEKHVLANDGQSALVLELERRKALRFHASKTPAEYVGEARLTDRGRASLAGLVAQLYRHLFGAVPCDAAEYQMFGDAAQELVRGQYVVPA